MVMAPLRPDSSTWPQRRARLGVLTALAAVTVAGCTSATPRAADEASAPDVPGLEALADEPLRDTGPPGVELEPVDAGPREDGPSALQAVTSGDPLDGALPSPLIDLAQIASGGPPPDGIPAIDAPRFQRTGDVRWVDDAEQVLVVEVAGQPRAYPVQVLTQHEIVNDTIGGVPVAVTYCPLGASGIAFDRRVGSARCRSARPDGCTCPTW